MIWENIQEQLQAATEPKFRIHRLLGYGGMAGVYLAEQPRLGRFVAIKVISPFFLTDPQAVDRFLHEARTVAKLSHPHIVTIHEIGEKDGLHYFTMSYVPGRGLGEVMDEAGGTLPVEVIKVWLAQVGTALDYAHRHGVVHRDIKPNNIILDAEGNAQVTDFGIAKVADQPGLTKTGALVGTPYYMSPEQCSVGDVTGKSDQYSLGTVAYQMVTGHAPFEGPTMSVLESHLREAPASIRSHRPDCPQDLADVIERMLLKDPEERWPSIGEALSTLVIANPDLDIGLRTRMAQLAAASGHLDLEGGDTPDSTPVPAGKEGTDSDVAADREIATGPDAAADPGVAREPEVATNPEVATDPQLSTGDTPAPVAGDSRGQGAPAPENAPPPQRTPPPLPPRGATIAASPYPTDPAMQGDPSVSAGGQEAEPATPLDSSPAAPPPSSPVTPPPSAAVTPSPSSPATPIPEAASPSSLTSPSPAAATVRGAGGGKRSGRDKPALVPWVGGGVLLAAAVVTGLILLRNGPSPEVDMDRALPEAPPPGAEEVSAAEDVSASPPAGGMVEGRVQVQGDLPQGYRIRVLGVDGRASSTSERELELAPGTYDLEISAPGYESANTTVVLSAGDVETWSPRLVSAEAPATPDVGDASAGPPEAPAEGRIRLLGDLPGSYRVRVRGEGTDRTFSTANIPLAPGEYQVSIEADGYGSRSTRLQVPAGGAVSWTPGLEAVAPPPSPDPGVRPARLRIQGDLPQGASVRVLGDGVDQESSGGEISLAPGAYELRFSAPGYRSQTTSLEVSPGEETSWRPELVREPPADLDARLTTELDRLASALEGRDLDRVRSEFPGAAQEIERVLGVLVQDRQNVRELSVTPGALTRVDVTADHAVVDVPLQLRYRDPRNAPGEGEVRFRARFDEEAGRWVLVSLEQRR